MTIVCLFAQRKCRYEGEYAPELLAAIDEYGDMDNPFYMNEQQEKAINDDDILFLKRLTVSISDEEFNKIFYGKHELKGTVLKESTNDTES